MAAIEQGGLPLLGWGHYARVYALSDTHVLKVAQIRREAKGEMQTDGFLENWGKGSPHIPVIYSLYMVDELNIYYAICKRYQPFESNPRHKDVDLARLHRELYELYPKNRELDLQPCNLLWDGDTLIYNDIIGLWK
jgi:hypothetical protein